MNARCNSGLHHAPGAAMLIVALGLAGVPALAQAHGDGYRRDNDRHIGHERGRHSRWNVNRGAFGWGYRQGYRRGYRQWHRHYRRAFRPRYGHRGRTSVRIWFDGAGFIYRDRCD